MNEIKFDPKSKNWLTWHKLLTAGLIIYLIFIFSNIGKNNTSSTSTNIEPTPSITKKDTASMSPFEILTEIGKDVAGDNSNISTFKNEDGSIDVTNNIQVTPEYIDESGMKVYAKKWATEFIRDSYNSGLDIRYVLVTVSFLYTGIPATRVGLGIEQAEQISSEDWKAMGSTGLCYVLKNSHIGDNVYPDSPSFNPSNWAFTKNCN